MLQELRKTDPTVPKLDENGYMVQQSDSTILELNSTTEEEPMVDSLSQRASEVGREAAEEEWMAALKSIAEGLPEVAPQIWTMEEQEKEEKKYKDKKEEEQEKEEKKNENEDKAANGVAHIRPSTSESDRPWRLVDEDPGWMG